MARFETAYNFIKKWEGGFANVAQDKGGITYAGITYKNFPTWSGWDYIFSRPQPIKRGTVFPELSNAVRNFYRLAFWDRYKFGNIIDQNVANILFDWFVNSGGLAAGTTGTETFGVDEILNRDFGKNLPIDKKIDSQTIAAINSVNAKQLYNTIKIEREKFYKKLVADDPSQNVFLTGWLNRLAAFPQYTGGVVGILMLLIISVILLFNS